MKALVNGRPTSFVAVADRGFQYGDGVFSTLLIRQGRPLFLDLHLARLGRDSRRLGFPVPDSETLVIETTQLCASQPEGVLKIQLTRGLGGRGYRPPDAVVPTRVLSIHPLPDYPPAFSANGVEARICHSRLGINPVLAGIKHMNRLEQIIARMEWSNGEIPEGLMLDHEGHVTEGTMTNLFLAINGCLVTPQLDLCGVAGVMRGLIMDGGFELGRVVAERRISLDELYAADELFLTNSVIGIWPIRRIESRDYKVGPITRELGAWLGFRVGKELAMAWPGD